MPNDPNRRHTVPAQPIKTVILSATDFAPLLIVDIYLRSSSTDLNDHYCRQRIKS